MRNQSSPGVEIVFLRFMLVCIAALVTVGCDDSASDDDSAAPVEGEYYGELEVVVSELVGTYVDISWATTEAAASFIEYGTDTSYGARVESGAGEADTHQVALALLIAGTEYHFRVGVTIDGEEWLGEDQTFTTSAPPSALPELTWVNEEPDAVTQGLMATGIIGSRASAVVLDQQGRYRWWHVEDNENGLITTVRLSSDGETVLYNLFWNDGIDTAAKIIRTKLDGNLVERRDVPDHHHDFLELPDGSLGALVFDTITVADLEAKGDKIIELPAEGPGNTQIWSVWDDFEYVNYPHPEGTGWSHANAMTYDPDEGMYYVGLRQQSCVVKIERETGELQWILGSSETDFDIDEDDRFRSQHRFQMLDDSILVFDNGSTEVLSSRAVEFSVDTTAWTAELQWEWSPTPPLYVLNLGDVHRLESGNTLVTLSSLGQIIEVTAAGDVVSELHTPMGSAFGYTDWVGEYDHGR